MIAILQTTFLNMILLYEKCSLLIQINYNLIKMGQLTTSQYWSIEAQTPPRTVIISVADALALDEGCLSQLSCFVDHTPSLTALLLTVSYCKIAAKLCVPPRCDKFA